MAVYDTQGTIDDANKPGNALLAGATAGISNSILPGLNALSGHRARKRRRRAMKREDARLAGKDVADYTGAETDYVLGRGKQGAQTILSRIERAKWQDYQDRYRPIEDILFGFTAPGYSAGQADKAKQTFQTGYDKGQQGFGRQAASLGLNVTPELAAERARLSDQRRSLGTVQAGNTALRQSNELQNYVLGAGTQTARVPGQTALQQG